MLFRSVDLGWRGSIQAELARLSRLSEGELYGCYVGLWAEALRPELNVRNTAGYLFHFGHPLAMAACVREAYVLLELIFSAPHGTVFNYERGADGRVNPILDAESGDNGEIRRAAFAALEIACLETHDALTSILGGAIPLPEIDAASALSALEALMLRPSQADVALVNRIPFIQYPHDATLLPAVNPLPLHEALLAPYKALRRLANAPWRAGAVRAALPWPLPMIPYDILTQRAHRLLRYGERFRRLLGRAK